MTSLFWATVREDLGLNSCGHYALRRPNDGTVGQDERRCSPDAISRDATAESVVDETIKLYSDRR